MLLSLKDTLSVVGFFLQIPKPLGRGTMAGFLCICGKESLAAVLPFPNGSSTLTWTDRRQCSRGWQRGSARGNIRILLHSTFTFKNLSTLNVKESLFPSFIVFEALSEMTHPVTFSCLTHLCALQYLLSFLNIVGMQGYSLHIWILSVSTIEIKVPQTLLRMPSKSYSCNLIQVWVDVLALKVCCYSFGNIFWTFVKQ